MSNSRVEQSAGVDRTTAGLVNPTTALTGPQSAATLEGAPGLGRLLWEPLAEPGPPTSEV